MKKRGWAILLSLLLVASVLPGVAAVAEERELYEFTLMQDFSSTDQPPESVHFFEKLEKLFNLKINLQVPPSSNYGETLQIMIASGDYPEAVLFPDVTNQAFRDAVSNDLVLSITPYLTEYGQNIADYSYDISMDTLKVLGGEDVYGIPHTSIVRADGFAVRKDWADHLGIELPEEGQSITLEAFTEILRAFTYDDPDGNGVKDTYGLRTSSVGGVLNVHGQIACAFDLLDWQEYDGEYIDLRYSRDHDNFKDVLTYMNMLWTEGYVDPDWPNITTEVAGQRQDAGMYGVATYFPGHIADLNATARKVNPNAEFIWLSGIENSEGVVRGSSFSTGLWGFTSLMVSAEKPERIIEMYNYMLSDEGWLETTYGLEGDMWQYNANGDMELIDPNKTGTFWFRNMVRRCDSPQFFVGLNVPAENRTHVMDMIQVAIDNNVFSLNAGFVAPVTSELSYIDYKSELDKVITKIIVGDLPVEAWDDALDGFYAAGYADFVEQTTAFIKESGR